ncbi:hypothetical protein PHMEG_00034137 [Phytophthora megakarya]|uniref:Peptidase A2 domain-containing protein n=1 Tax=Phytophthora megakarya TaxID=4795 RepID=A0A225URS5_9STRA|nr:hypothetical protein PHMEG_00034137 [Phytophthora megakarya]
MWISNLESHEVIGDSKIQICDLNQQITRLLRKSRGLARSRSTDGQQPWIYSPKITGKIHYEKAILLLDTGAEVSIVDTTFARKVRCYIDSSQIQDSVGIGDNVYRTEERIRIKVYLLVPAGIRLDLAHGSNTLPDEVRIQLSGSRQLYSDKAKIVNVGQYLRIRAGESSIHDKLWVTRGDSWVPTISDGPGRTKYISITNIGDEVFTCIKTYGSGSS